MTIALDDMLPAERIVGVDSGNFLGCPSMSLSVPDEAGFCFTQAFQSIGLGLATTIGASLARPDRIPLAALARGLGFEAVTVRTADDLDGVRRWVASDRSRPLLVDAEVVRDRPSWWLEDAFRGH